MSYRLLIALISLFFTGSVFAQAEGFKEGIQAAEKQENTLKKSLEVVTQRVAELEKLYEKLAANPSKVQLKSIVTGKDKILVVHDDQPGVLEGHHQVSHLKFVQYEFAGNKIKNIKLIYEKKNFHDNLIDSTKTLTIDPAAIDNSIVEEKTLPNTAYDKKSQALEKTSYKDFSPETKFKTLKMLERQLLNSIYKVEILLRKNVISDDIKANQLMEGI
jgi:hypothetical protein